MTIQPLAPTERPADPDAGTEDHPLPDGWCYACWMSACRGAQPAGWHGPMQPATLAATAERVASRVLTDAEMPLRMREWQPGQVELVRAVAVELNLIATSVEAFQRQ